MDYDLASDLRALLRPGEVFFNWGPDEPLYYYAKQIPPSKTLMHLRLQVPGGEVMALEVVEDLKRIKPEIVVFGKDPPDRGILNNPVGRWVVENYVRYRKEPYYNTVALMVRKGGRLEASSKLNAADKAQPDPVGKPAPGRRRRNGPRRGD